MGSLTHITGEIYVTPTIPWGEIKDSPFLFKDGGRWTVGDKSVALALDERTVETDDGTLTQKWATGIVPAADEAYKAYSIVTDVQELVDTFGKDRTFTGMLEGEGERNGDLWRLIVRANKVAVKVKAQIVWPDEVDQ